MLLASRLEPIKPPGPTHCNRSMYTTTRHGMVVDSSARLGREPGQGTRRRNKEVGLYHPKRKFVMD